MTTLEQRDRLVRTYLPLADRLASWKNSCTPNSVSFDDLQSAAYWGLLDAAGRCQNEQTFETYARTRIIGAMNDYLREQYHVGTQADLDDTPEDICWNSETFDCLINKLDCTGREVLRYYYVDGLEQKEIGVKLGVGESRICQVLRACREELRNMWDEEEAWGLVA